MGLEASCFILKCDNDLHSELLDQIQNCRFKMFHHHLFGRPCSLPASICYRVVLMLLGAFLIYSPCCFTSWKILSRPCSYFSQELASSHLKFLRAHSFPLFKDNILFLFYEWLFFNPLNYIFLLCLSQSLSFSKL